MVEPNSPATNVEAEGAVPDAVAPRGSHQRYEEDIDDAIYYLQHDCVPCAERHFDRARRHGASEEEIASARSRAQGK